MHIGLADKRMLIDLDLSEYADLIAGLMDLDEQLQPIHISRPVANLLAAHQEFAGELAPEPAPPPVVLTGQGSYARRWPDSRPYGRSHTAELIGAPVESVRAELAPVHTS